MTEESNSRPSLRDLRLVKLMIDTFGGERHVVSLWQLEEWLNQMSGRPITARDGHRCQLTRGQDPEGRLAFWLSSVE